MAKINSTDWANMQTNGGYSPIEWSLPILEYAKKGMRVLEIGAGTATTTTRLAKLGIDAWANDYSQELVKQYRKGLCFDVMGEWPEENFDLIHSAGLLEHFSDEEIVLILSRAKEHSKYQIHLVPNAKCTAYVSWKDKRIKDNDWPYGDEFPKLSMRKLYKQAGLKLIREYSVGNEFISDGEHYLLVSEGK